MRIETNSRVTCLAVTMSSPIATDEAPAAVGAKRKEAKAPQVEIKADQKRNKKSPIEVIEEEEEEEERQEAEEADEQQEEGSAEGGDGEEESE